MALIADQVVDVHDALWKELRSHRLPGPEAIDASITAVIWREMSHQRATIEIDQPILNDGRTCVDERLDVAVVIERRISNFDDQQNIGGPWMRLRVEVIARSQQHDVRLRFRVEV